MNILFSPTISSKKLEIIQKRDTNLTSKSILNEILKKGFLDDENRFTEIFWFSVSIYDKIPKRFSNEKYTQHPLRMLKKSLELEFKNQTLSEIILAHDVIESLREYKNYFSNPTILEDGFMEMFSDNYHHVVRLTPPQDNSSKEIQLEDILKTAPSVSSIEVKFPIKMKVPTILPVPLCVIAKIFDIHDNCYDQRKYKPNGILFKTKQIEQVKSYLEKNFYTSALLSNALQNYAIGFPTNTPSILNALLDNAEENLEKIPENV